jgi:DNA excision repair protein ERCC-4
MSHSELRPEDITAIIDTREQRPWSLAPLKTKRATLVTGDVSVAGLEDILTVERKSLGDLLGCMGGARKRFEEEIERLQAYPMRAVIVEASYGELVDGGWLLGMSGDGSVRSKVHPNSAIGSVLGWMGSGIPFLFCRDAAEADLMAARFLFICARRRYRELSGFYDSLELK